MNFDRSRGHRGEEEGGIIDEEEKEFLEGLRNEGQGVQGGDVGSHEGGPPTNGQVSSIHRRFALVMRHPAFHHLYQIKGAIVV